MGKFSKHPIIDTEPVSKLQVQEFLSGASVKTKPQDLQFPWYNMEDNKKSKGVNLRLTKMDLAKLQYVSEHTPYSQQKFIYEAMKLALDHKIGELLKNK